MGTWNPLQDDFTAGEISPRLNARESADIYQRGLSVMRNMVPLSQGSAVRRFGSKFEAEVLKQDLSPASTGRIGAFQLTDSDTYLAVASDGQMQLWRDAAIAPVDTVELLENPNFYNGFDDWEILGEATFEWVALYDSAIRASYFGLSGSQNVINGNNTFTQVFNQELNPLGVLTFDWSVLWEKSPSSGSVRIWDGYVTISVAAEDGSEVFYTVAFGDRFGQKPDDAFKSEIDFKGFAGEVEVVVNFFAARFFSGNFYDWGYQILNRCRMFSPAQAVTKVDDLLNPRFDDLVNADWIFETISGGIDNSYGGGTLIPQGGCITASTRDSSANGELICYQNANPGAAVFNTKKLFLSWGAEHSSTISLGRGLIRFIIQDTPFGTTPGEIFFQHDVVWEEGLYQPAEPGVEALYPCEHGELSAEVDFDGHSGDVYCIVYWDLRAGSLELPPRADNVAPGPHSVYQFQLYEETAIPPPAGDNYPVVTIPYTDEELKAVQFVENPYVAEVVFVHPDHAPHKLWFDALGSGVWEFDPISFTWPVSSPWSANNYPRACGSFQGRLVLGGTTESPQTVWATKPGDWTDMGVSAPLVATDALNFTLADIGTIQWIEGQKELLIGTVNGEHAVGAQSGLVGADDIGVNKQSQYGSRHIQAENIGDQVLYPSSNGRKVRGAEFARDFKGWMSPDLSLPSEHITQGVICQIAMTRDIHTEIVWYAMENGQMIGMTYERSTGQLGWHQHFLGEGTVDVCRMRVNGQDQLFMLNKRNGKLQVESIADLNPYLDSYIYQEYEPAVLTITGLEQFEGRSVNVIADNKSIGAFVVTGGQLTFEEAYNQFYIGLTYASFMQTLPRRGGRDGLGSSKANFRIGVRLVNSGQPIINGELISPDRYGNPDTDGTESDFTGQVDQFDLGWKEINQITIEEKEPKPLNVIGLYTETRTENT